MTWTLEAVESMATNGVYGRSRPVPSRITTTTKECEMSDAIEYRMPQPDPSLEKLTPLVGSWKLSGHLTGRIEENISGTATFQWLAGGYFLQQDVELDFLNVPIKSREIIGCDPGTGKMSSLVFSNMSPTPLPYSWEVDGDTLIIGVNFGVLDATFHGSLSKFHGSWQPNPGADLTANVAYEITSERIG